MCGPATCQRGTARAVLAAALSDYTRPYLQAHRHGRLHANTIIHKGFSLHGMYIFTLRAHVYGDILWADSIAGQLGGNIDPVDAVHRRAPPRK